jgi:hypothetical protein
MEVRPWGLSRAASAIAAQHVCIEPFSKGLIPMAQIISVV